MVVGNVALDDIGLLQRVNAVEGDLSSLGGKADKDNHVVALAWWEWSMECATEKTDESSN